MPLSREANIFLFSLPTLNFSYIRGSPVKGYNKHLLESQSPPVLLSQDPHRSYVKQTIRTRNLAFDVQFCTDLGKKIHHLMSLKWSLL